MDNFKCAKYELSTVRLNTIYNINAFYVKNFCRNKKKYVPYGTVCYIFLYC